MKVEFEDNSSGDSIDYHIYSLDGYNQPNSNQVFYYIRNGKTPPEGEMRYIVENGDVNKEMSLFAVLNKSYNLVWSTGSTSNVVVETNK